MRIHRSTDHTARWYARILEDYIGVYAIGLARFICLVSARNLGREAFKKSSSLKIRKHVERECGLGQNHLPCCEYIYIEECAYTARFYWSVCVCVCLQMRVWIVMYLSWLFRRGTDNFHFGKSISSWFYRTVNFLFFQLSLLNLNVFFYWIIFLFTSISDFSSSKVTL